MRRIKHLPHFLAGFLAAALLFSIGASALAFSGAVSFGGVKVVLAGEQALAANEGVTAPNGVSVPGSVAYTDEKNGGTIYLPLRRISDLLDASVDYDAATKTVYVGGVPVSTGDITVSNPNGDPITLPGKEGETAIPVFVTRETQIGPFTKVDTHVPTANEIALSILDGARFIITGSSYESSFALAPAHGQYVTVTVTNHGEEDLILRLYHDKKIGSKEVLPSMRAASGETVSCTLELNDTITAVNGNLGLYMTGSNTYALDAIVTIAQF